MENYRSNSISMGSVLINLILFISLLFAQNQPLAFPGAEGFGRFTTGGRGGVVLFVTNLNDDDPGSLRNAIVAKGARTVIFKVSGTIILKSPLIIKNDDITIAGQTAPGDGICIRDYPLIIEADNVILRFLRSRLGDVHKLAEDACSAIFQKDLIIDHCSFSWAIDEVLTVRDNENSTVQWCIISESLHHSYHHKGDHGYGGIWGGQNATFHHNLIANNASRNPRFCGSRYSHQPEKEIVDFRNNVIFNWGFNSSYGGEAGNHNIISNYYKSGPGTQHKNRILEPWGKGATWFIQNNLVDGYPRITADNWAGGVQGDYATEGRLTEPLTVAPVKTQDAKTAFELVLEYAGAILPKRDPVDARIVDETRIGKNRFGGFWKKNGGIIDSQITVGGWPELKSAPALNDSDADGMPDAWESQNGLNPKNPDDRNDVQNNDGYTNLERYINGLVLGTGQ